MKKKIPKEEVIENWLEDSSTIEIEEYATKHDCHAVIYVTKNDDKYWKYTIEYSYNDGIQVWGDTITVTEVKPVEVLVTKWEVVKENEVQKAS